MQVGGDAVPERGAASATGSSAGWGVNKWAGCGDDVPEQGAPSSTGGSVGQLQMLAGCTSGEGAQGRARQHMQAFQPNSSRQVHRQVLLRRVCAPVQADTPPAVRASHRSHTGRPAGPPAPRPCLSSSRPRANIKTHRTDPTLRTPHRSRTGTRAGPSAPHPCWGRGAGRWGTR